MLLHYSIICILCHGEHLNSRAIRFKRVSAVEVSYLEKSDCFLESGRENRFCYFMSYTTLKATESIMNDAQNMRAMLAVRGRRAGRGTPSGNCWSDLDPRNTFITYEYDKYDS